MYNHYALITGASEGLGKCLALECARRGINLVLVALPGSSLLHLAHYIGNTWDVDVVCIETDLAAVGSCQRLYEEVKARGIRINVLINNAGMGGTFYFHEKEAAYYEKQISLNVLAPTQLCRLFLDDLKAGGTSYILNVSSLAGLFHLPRKQVYGGTKSYLITFTRSLRSELQAHGVSVSVLCPGGMNTHWQLTMSNCTTGTWLGRRSVMQPEAVAQRAVRAMLKGKEVIVPGFLNNVFLLMDAVSPRFVKNILIRLQLRTTTGKDQVREGGQIHIITEAPEYTYAKSAG